MIMLKELTSDDVKHYGEAGKVQQCRPSVPSRRLN